MRRVMIAIVIMLISSAGLYAEEYSFEMPANADVKPEANLEWSGNLDGKYTLFQRRQSSPLYALQFWGEDVGSDALSQYQLEWYLNGDYQRSDVGMHLKTHLNYLNTETDENVDFEVFELYGNLNLSISSFVQAGKIRYNWGKGYAFNPAGFVNPVKNPENPELEQAGLLSIGFETIKTFQSDVLKTAALTTIVIPPQADLKDRFGDAENTDVAAKLYLMLGKFDVDLMGYYSRNNPSRVGGDFAVNLKENLEAHGEFSAFQDVPKHTIVSDQLRRAEDDGMAYLVGMRWLNRWEITTILEYYHTDLGLTDAEFGEYLTLFSQSLASGSDERITRALGYMQQGFKGNTSMQDYLYVQVQKPEPFDWLYFTPTLSAIYNLNDQSALVTFSFSYKPITNFELLVRPAVMVGKKGSEYGSQQFRQRVEAWARFYF